ncbi:MAG: tetratricopeptide repeat protein [Candidatus Cloacimonetes bacterium]|nr:tetratricopeptide repeat protein [Candidatus Cloacimonadota bacterium]
MRRTGLLFLLLFINITLVAELNLSIALKDLGGKFEVRQSGVYAEAFEIPEVLLPQEYIDHPERILNQAGNKKKMYILNKLARDSWKHSFDKSLEYGNQALECSQEAHLDVGIVISHLTLAKTYLMMEDYDKATEEYLNAESVILLLRNKKELQEIYDGLTEVWEKAGELEKALQYAQQSLEIRKSENDAKSYSDQLVNIGNVYYRFGNYESALDYYYQALDLEEHAQFIDRLPLLRYNLAITYYHLGAYSEALININYLLESADNQKNRWELADGLSYRGYLHGRMGKFELALEDYQRAQKIYIEIKDFASQINTSISIGNIYMYAGETAKAKEVFLQAKPLAERYNHKTGLAAIYNNLGLISQMSKDYAATVDQLISSLNLDKEENNQIGIITSLYNLGNIYFALHNFDSSVSSFLSGLEISQRLNERMIIKEIYSRIAELYAAQGNFETALNYHKKYSQMNYELNIEDLQTRYEVGKKRFEIELLKKQNTILNLQKSRLWLGLISLVILVLLMIWVNNSKSKTNKLLKIEIDERTRTGMELKKIKDELELRVQNRTAELTKLNESLLREITERRQYQEKLELSLEEKDVMMKEIHHRVKNNMQVISSLLRMQANYIEDPNVVEAFNDSFHRVKSMSLIHEKLYRSDDLAHINFQDYVESLTRLLYHTFTPSARLEFIIDMKDIFLDINNAIPCGLIINELITNSLKYAFRDRTEGKIAISMTRDLFSGFRLIVKDDGIGLPDDFDINKTKSLGMRLVYLLSEDQLEGKVTIKNEQGTGFEIEFPGISE